MNFEERLAQTQAKMDELKAKINDSIDSAKEAQQAKKDETLVKLAKMNASIEDFGRDVEAQIYCDVTSMKDEVKADTTAVKDALDEIGDKAEAKAEAVDAAMDEADARIDAKVNSDLDAVDEAIEKINDKIDTKIQEGADKYNEAADKLEAKINDGLDAIEGDYYAGQEDLRLAKERYESKLNAIRLKIQMHQEQAKAKIEAKKTAVDKAVQEELISDLLDYADDCQLMAYAYAMEAELAILDACDEIADYEAKYGALVDDDVEATD